MFRKRTLPTAESATIRKTVEDENPILEQQQQDEVNEGTIKRNKLLSLGGVKIISEEAEKVTKEEIVDGSVLEEDMEAKRAEEVRKKDAALVTVEQPVKTKTTSKFGPSSAPAYVRATTIVDYKPDLCKDYNQTGYCGYGDTCIYLHDRTTYVSGNILDQRWDEMMKGKQQKKEEPKMVNNDKNSCGICKQVLATPVVKTRCGHCFCRTCAFERFESIPTCATCGLQTLGIFNDVHKNDVK